MGARLRRVDKSKATAFVSLSDVSFYIPPFADDADDKSKADRFSYYVPFVE